MRFPESVIIFQFLLSAIFLKAGQTEIPGVISEGSCGANKYNNSDKGALLLRPYIVGGSTALPNYYPWHISLQYGNAHDCGGAIINKRYIVTAAHCFTGSFTPSVWSVAVGKHSLNKVEATEKKYKVAQFYKHENYSEIASNVNDIALVKLTTDINFTSEVQPVCLSSELGDLVGVNAYVTGWGALRQGGSSPTSRGLQEVLVPIIANSECQELFPNDVIGPGMLCAGYEQGGKDACQGDSGGPMVLKINGQWTLAGVVSWGYGCGVANSPGIYTRVTHYLEWIDKIVN